MTGLYAIMMLVGITVSVALAFLPGVAVAKWILTPVDRAARFHEAPARFSIGDFLCLFAAVQIPLAAVYRLKGPESEPQFWVFTIMTWLIAPVIWLACARALSKAAVTTAWHRFVFLALIMPLVYYGLIPFTFIGIALFVAMFDASPMHFGWMPLAWAILCTLFFGSSLFVRWMLTKVNDDQPLITESEHQRKLAKAAMRDRARGSAPVAGDSEKFGGA